VKIAIPSTEESVLCPHFGHAPYFAVVEISDKTKEIVSTTLLKPDMGGHAAVPPWLKSLGVSSLIAGGLGSLAIENLNTHDIDVFYGAPELPISEIVRLYLKDELVLNPQPCSHTHDHDCEHTEHQHG
jgi:predicted Fe-Mo cluster-binding NifX family protein